MRAGSVASSPDALNATRFTLETWFYRTGTGATTSTGTGGVTAAPLIAKGRSQSDGSNVDLNYFLGIDSSGRLAADFEEGAGQPSPGLNHPVTGSTVITNNAWHHAAVTYDGRTWKLYLDGRLDRTLTLASPLNPRSDSIQRTALGSALNSSGTAAGFFRGRMDEARIWNVARTGQQIRQWRDDQITGPQAGLLARFGMGEGSGTTVANSAGSPSGVLRPSGAGPTWVSGYTFPQDTTAPSAPGGPDGSTGDGDRDAVVVGERRGRPGRLRPVPEHQPARDDGRRAGQRRRPARRPRRTPTPGSSTARRITTRSARSTARTTRPRCLPRPPQRRPAAHPIRCCSSPATSPAAPGQETRTRRASSTASPAPSSRSATTCTRTGR